MKVIKFKCGYCKDGIVLTRKELRNHLRENHLRNEFFNWKGIDKQIKRDEIIREVFE